MSPTRLGQVLLPLVGLIALLLAACGQQAGASSLAKDQTFTWPFLTIDGTNSISGEILEPAQISDAEDETSASLIYSGLVTIDNNLHVVNDLAKSIDVDPSGTVYTFHLLPNLKFSDGTPLTAQDFAYSINRTLDPSLTNASDFFLGLTYLGHILGAQARNSGTIPTMIANGNNPNFGLNVIDNQTLIIRLDKPVGFFLEALTYPTAYPVEQSLVTKYPNGAWVNHLDAGGCSGPFKVKSYNGGKEISYVPNTAWETATHHTLTLTEIDRPFIDTNDNEYKNYKAGQYDYTDVPNDQYIYAKGQDDYHEEGELEIDYFAFNFTKPPFDNLQVRQAFDLALDKQLLVDRTTGGGAIPTNHIVPQGMPGYDPALTNPAPDKTQSLTGNPTAALQLLSQAQANCKGDSFTDPNYCPYISTKSAPGGQLLPIMIYANNNNPTRVNITKTAADAWDSVLGLNVQEQSVTFGALLGAIGQPAATDPYQAWAIGWLADYPDPQDWLTLQFASTAGNNSSGLNVNETDVPGLDDLLLKQADVEQDPTKRMQLYNQAEQMIVDDVGWLPYMQGKAKWRIRSWVRGFGLNEEASIPDISWPNVFISAH